MSKNNIHHYQRQTIFQSFICLLVYIFRLDKRNPKPYALKAVGNKYHLIKEINKISSNKKYGIGIYQNKSNKYFIKTWQGKVKNFDYYDLMQEAEISKYLNQVNFNDTKIKFAKYLETISSNGKISVVFQYIPGSALETMEKDFQKRTLNLVINYFNNIKFEVVSDSPIPTHSKAYYLVSVIALTIVSIYKNIRNFIPILKQFFNSILELISLPASKYSFSHTDFGANNIVVTKNFIYIVDSANLVFTIPGFNEAQVGIETKFYSSYFKLLKYSFSV